MDFTDIVEPLLREAGVELMKHYGNIEAASHKSADAHDVVTDLDVWTEKFLSEGLKKAFPEIGFVGEETGGDRAAKRFWLCDPIDGPGQFIRGMPFCSTMLALIEEDEVTFSAIYDFVREDLYLAIKGGGATCNGKTIHVKDYTLSQSYISYETRLDKDENVKKFVALRGRCALFAVLTAGFEYMMIASGKLEGRICFEPYGKDYDFAPGSLLVAEAGGIVRNIGKTTYDYRNLNFIAANPATYRDLTEGPDALFPVV